MLGSPTSRHAAAPVVQDADSREQQYPVTKPSRMHQVDAAPPTDSSQLPQQVIYHFAVGRAIPDPRIEASEAWSIEMGDNYAQCAVHFRIVSDGISSCPPLVRRHLPNYATCLDAGPSAREFRENLQPVSLSCGDGEISAARRLLEELSGRGIRHDPRLPHRRLRMAREQHTVVATTGRLPELLSECGELLFQPATSFCSAATSFSRRADALAVRISVAQARPGHHCGGQITGRSALPWCRAGASNANPTAAFTLRQASQRRLHLAQVVEPAHALGAAAQVAGRLRARKSNSQRMADFTTVEIGLPEAGVRTHGCPWRPVDPPALLVQFSQSFADGAFIQVHHRDTIAD